MIGSGIAAQPLSPGDVGLQLFENAAATAAGLFAIILMFGPVSGGHFNPVVSFVDASFGGLSRRDALAYVPAQITGCILGAIAANAMFSEALISISTHHRASPAHLFSEVIATLGLLLVIFALARTNAVVDSPGRRRCLHRRRLLLHQLDELREPGDQHRPHVLQHLRRDRPRIGPRVRHRPARRRCASRSALIRYLYPDFTPEEAAEVVLPHQTQPEGPTCELVAIGGSDAGTSAALRARELDPSADVTVVVADAYPNFSICGIPYYVSGEVTHWRNLAHRIRGGARYILRVFAQLRSS